MTKQSHTQFESLVRDGVSCDAVITDKNGALVCKITEANGGKTAEFIFRAYNTHDELVGVLKANKKRLETELAGLTWTTQEVGLGEDERRWLRQEHDEIKSLLDQTNAALAKARGE